MSQRLAVILIILSLNGCSSIDYATMREQAYYQKTAQGIREIESQDRPDLESQPLFAGSAKVQIITPDGIPLAGYGDRSAKQSISVNDSVYVRALAVSAGDKRVVIVASDLLAISNEIYDTVLKKVNRAMPLQAEDLIISATHTHSGPGGLSRKFWEQFATGTYDPDFFESLTDSMASAIIQAIAELKPVRMRAHRAQAPDLIRNRMIDNGPTDAEVGILEFQALDGLKRVLLVNFAAHATVLGSDNLSVSGDYPGAMERHLERNADTHALFTAGAVADQTARPPEVDRKVPSLVQLKAANAMGALISERVQAEIPYAEWVECGVVDSLRLPLYLPASQVRVSTHYRLPSFIGDFFFDRQSSLHALRVGNQVLLGIPADLSSEIGMRIKEYAQRQGLRVFIIGFANDYVGYVIPREQYDTDEYEARMSFNGPHMGQYVQEIAFQMIDLLGKRESTCFNNYSCSALWSECEHGSS